MSLQDWGYSSAWAERFLTHAAAGLAPARVTGAHRGVYDLITAGGPAHGQLAGRLEFAAESPLDS
jgi:hypothetical protein